MLQKYTSYFLGSHSHEGFDHAREYVCRHCGLQDLGWNISLEFAERNVEDRGGAAGHGALETVSDGAVNGQLVIIHCFFIHICVTADLLPRAVLHKGDAFVRHLGDEVFEHGSAGKELGLGFSRDAFTGSVEYQLLSIGNENQKKLWSYLVDGLE